MFIYNKFYDKFQQVVQVVYILAAVHSDLAIGRARGHVDPSPMSMAIGMAESRHSMAGNVTVFWLVSSFHARPWHLILTCTLMP